MTKFQVGDKAEILNPYSTMDKAKIGGVATIARIRNAYNTYEVMYETTRTSLPCIGYTDGSNLKLIEPKPTKNQRISALEKEVAELKQLIQANPTLIRPQFHVGVDLASGKDLSVVVPALTNNQKRAAIIEKAKQFVEEILGKYECFPTKIGFFENQQVQATFHVNAKKHAVVVLIHGHFSKKLYSKGIAKCHPHDVFNADIGKAIALGRALGLDVSEFEQAVQPDEVAVGMDIEYKGKWLDGEKRTVKDIKPIYRTRKRFLFECGRTYTEFVKNDNLNNFCRITNDTNAQYEEVK